MGAAGDTTPTDPRSQRNRASRRGGQLTNASSQLIVQIGLPAPSCSRCAPVPDGRTIRRNKSCCSVDSSTDIFIPVNNPLERLLREIRRRTRVVGAFPDGQSALNLAAARLCHIAGTAWSTKRYLNMELLKDQQMRGAITA